MAQRTDKAPRADELVFVPLGGIGEIGMNVASGSWWIWA
jgi:hypothetical protein